MVLTTTPVIGAPLSGIELLERFDARYAAAVLDSYASPYAYPTEEDPDQDPDTLVVIIEHHPYPIEEHPEGQALMYAYPPQDAPPAPLVPPVPGFVVTSGINVPSESTFDSMRTIVGFAPRGTVIRIDVFGYNYHTDSFYQTGGSFITVGASGNFSSVQQLDLGRNFIRIKAAYNEGVSSDFSETFVSIKTAQLNRLTNEVRNQLERGLLLP